MNPHPSAQNSMENQIVSNLNHPGTLEKLYRENKAAFTRVFKQLYPTIQENPTAQVWDERLNYSEEGINWGTRKDFIFISVAVFLAGLIAKIPDLTGLEPDYFYQRNIAFVVFPFLSAYFAWKQQLTLVRMLPVVIVFLLSAVYINLLPVNLSSDTLILACIHLPLFLWSLLGYTFTGCSFQEVAKRLDFLRFNGDLAVMGAVIVIAGMLFTGISFNLFQLIGLDIEQFYEHYVVIWGGAAIPIVATFIVRTNPQLVSKVSPVIALVFTPLVLVFLIIYLIAMAYTGKDPYNDREFLLIFNVLLIGVMAIILFSVAEAPKEGGRRATPLVLLLLAVVTILVNGIALSAIVFRISEWGITPNRLAVLGGNVLILTNLLIVAYKLYRTIIRQGDLAQVENSIARFLPVYVLWSGIVAFLFPLLFGFR